EPCGQGLRATATQGGKVDLALRAVADAGGLECTDEDLETEIEGVAERVGQSPESVREQFERVGQISAVRSDIRKRKALEWLIERVEVRDEDGAPLDRSELQPPDDEDEQDDEGVAWAAGRPDG